ncbi:hypothetical protein Plhal304r1_c029g0096131 [Plasmopara halstedii]
MLLSRRIIPFFRTCNQHGHPKKLIMQPVITNMTAGSSSRSDMINPFRNSFSTVPATMSYFAALRTER